MALLGRQADYHIRQSNKEPDWSSICNNVFDQFLDTDDLFGFDPDPRERSSSNDTANLFDFSGSSEQSHQTEATSPIPAWEPATQEHLVVAKQPRAKESVDFWTKTLRALEQNAAECERQQQTLRSTKSHPDFLSLGGCPSPPAIPLSPTDQSYSAQRRVSRSTANGKRRNITARSVSRGRPAGVTKAPVTGSTNPYATVRKCSASPPKMMNPSRYRAGFKDVWTEKLQSSPKKYELAIPSMRLPDSPPPSARIPQGSQFAAFGSPNAYGSMPAYDEQMSPLTNTFQQAHIHTPVLSPAIDVAAHASDSYFDPLPTALAKPYGQQSNLQLNDTAPLYPERTSSLVANNIQTFDFGFSSSPVEDNWSTAPFAEPAPAPFTIGQFSESDPFGPISSNVLPIAEIAGLPAPGLGISCDPSLVSNLGFPGNGATLPFTVFRPEPTRIERRGPPTHQERQSRSRHRRSKSCRRSQSPSPPPAGIRSRKEASSRRASRHRRPKSTNSTPRQTQNLENGGFVNFTPHDCNKILSGVAPSGSSKTKARREKEAADKRRRMSQAAVKAVVDAGGDLNALSKAGLFSEQDE